MSILSNGFVLVAAGGAMGASARHAVNLFAVRIMGASFPFGTLFVNVMGSFLMGVLAGVLAMKLSDTDNIRLFLGVGLLGGFTTFSAFSLEAVSMYQRKAYGVLLGYAGSSVLLAIGALILGLIAARRILGS